MKNSSCKTVLLLLLCFISFNALAQSSEEQLKKYIEEARKAENEDDFMASMNSADSFTRKIKDIGAQAQVNRDIANYFFDKDPDKCVEYMTKAFRMYTTAGNKKDAALCLNNTAFAYEEKKNIPEAMKFTKRAITAHTERKDTLGMANMYKYQSMLYGKMHDYDNGKKAAAKAIQLFNAKNYRPGVAVSYYDLAVVYEEEREYDSSIALLLKAKEIWKQSDDGGAKSRIYGNNTALIRLYTRTNMMAEAEEMVQQNEATDPSVLHYTEQLKFYKESKDYYAKNKDKETSKMYKEKYSTLRDNMKADGKNVD